MADTSTILKKRQEEDTIVTTVEFDFDGEKQVIDIPHFRPASLDEVIAGITNRLESEKAKREAVKKAEQIFSEIKTSE